VNTTTRSNNSSTRVAANGKSKVNYWTGYIYCIFCCWLNKPEYAHLGQSWLAKLIARHDLLSYIVVVCCWVIRRVVAPSIFLNCTPCVVWMICFHAQGYPISFKRVIDWKLTIVDDKHVGYLVCFSFIGVWWHMSLPVDEVLRIRRLDWICLLHLLSLVEYTWICVA